MFRISMHSHSLQKCLNYARFIRPYSICKNEKFVIRFSPTLLKENAFHSISKPDFNTVPKIPICQGPQIRTIYAAVTILQRNLQNNQQSFVTTLSSKATNNGCSGNGKFRHTRQKFQETRKKVTDKIDAIKLRENIFTIPNGLCVVRIALTPVIGYFVLTDMYCYAVAFFTVAGLTDLFDGLIARTFPSQKSVLGSFLDPIADKLLVATLFITLTATSLIPVPLTLLIISRDVALVASGFYIRYLSLPKPRTLSRYFDITLPTAKLSPTFTSKVNTALQLILVGLSLGAPVFHYVDHAVLHALWYTTAASTIISGISYLLARNTYEIISKSRKSSFK